MNNPGKISTLLFDWDGTLMDSAGLGWTAFQAAFQELGFSVSQSSYDAVYSPNWYRMYEALGLPTELWPRADALWLQYYNKGTPCLLEGVEEVLASLGSRGYRFGLVSSGTCSRIHGELEDLKLRELFEVVLCNEQIVQKKPHPESLERAMSTMGALPSSCAYIGDSPEDIEMGKAAGVFTIGVRSSYPTSHRLVDCGPDLVLESVRELCHLFKGPTSSEP